MAGVARGVLFAAVEPTHASVDASICPAAHPDVAIELVSGVPFV
jgi:hypothetical protein